VSVTTNIEWCDSTFNPWIGCTKVSPACDHCYAERSTPARTLGVEWGAKGERHRTAPANWSMPKRWNAQAEAFQAKHGRRQRVFCASLADVFDNKVPAQWRADLFHLIQTTPNLDWLVLTKRIGNVRCMLANIAHGADPDLLLVDQLPLHNLWLGATICNQEEADRDIPKLLDLPARVRFLSIEPMLGPVDLRRVGYEEDDGSDFGGWEEWDAIASWGNVLTGEWSSGERRGDAISNDVISWRTSHIDWVICGGESGPEARPMHTDWARGLRDQCAAVGTPFLFKQWGEWLPICEDDEGLIDRLYRSNRKAEPHEDQGAIDELYGRTCTVPCEVHHRDGSRHHFLEPNAFIPGAMSAFKVGKKVAGRRLQSATHDGFPPSAED
jgi:protein gp37